MGSSLRGSCRHPLLRLALAALLAPLPAWGGTGEPDTQLWTELDVTGPLATNTTITGIAKARFSETLANPTLTALEADLNHKVGEWWLSIG
ncbi:MAG: hypothetical protein JO203_08360, partial [Gammaproteobacteria bacterium]|nr:hypothetical protein [Gammaproteobacteria bacterium]